MGVFTSSMSYKISQYEKTLQTIQWTVRMNQTESPIIEDLFANPFDWLEWFIHKFGFWF